MRRMHAVAAAGLAAVLAAACAAATAQEGPGPGGPARPAAPPERDPEVDAWAKALAARIADPHPAIARSARLGLGALGPGALPELGRLAGSPDPAVVD